MLNYFNFLPLSLNISQLSKYPDTIVIAKIYPPPPPLLLEYDQYQYWPVETLHVGLCMQEHNFKKVCII